MTPRSESTARATAAVAIEPMQRWHGPGVLAVYAQGMAAGDSTFETAVPTWEEWDRARLPDHRFVAVPSDPQPDAPSASSSDVPPASSSHPPSDHDPVVLGWVAVSRVSPRAAYAGVVEHSVYVAEAARGRGVGGALMRRLVQSCDAGGIWTIQSGVFAENAASLALHERSGFRPVGVRERIGCRDGRWRDVVLLERRSAVVGVDT